MADRNIYILGGQSNALGATGLPYEDTNREIPGWSIFRNNGTLLFPLSDDNNIGSGVGFSIELPFADVMQQSGEEGYILKVPFDGQAIGEKESSSDMNYRSGESFDTIEAIIGLAIAKVISDGDTPIFKGFFWIHGEHDSINVRLAGLYKKNLHEMVRMVRDSTSTPDLPVLSLLTSNKLNVQDRSQLNVVRSGIFSLTNDDNRFFSIEHNASVLGDYTHHTRVSMISMGKLFSDFYLGEDTYIPPSPHWRAPDTLLNGWVNFGSVYSDVEFRRIGDTVEVRGLVRSGTVGQPIFNLPEYFRPSFRVLTMTNTNTSPYSELRIDTNGDVNIQSGTNAYVSMEFSFGI